MLHNFDFNIAVISILIILLARPYSYKEEKRFRKTICFSKSLFLVHFKPSIKHTILKPKTLIYQRSEPLLIFSQTQKCVFKFLCG